MRDVINKNVTEAQLLETAERVFSRGFDRMKLYFILGLPTETDEDVAGILEVGKNALSTGHRVGKRPKVTVSVSIHVPKPHTPFQWCAMDTPEDVERKQALLRDGARGVRGLSLKLHDSVTSYLEGVMARGDRRLGEVIERAYLKGARFDSWEEELRLDVWREAFEHFGIETAPYLATLPLSARLPWDHIDVGLEDGFLAREYRKALQSRLSPPCGKPKGAFVHHANVEDAESDQRRLVCYDCGVACDMSAMRQGRVDYLRNMGALEKAPRARLPLASSTPSVDAAVVEERAAPVRSGPERYRPPQAAGIVVRYRLRYAKTGAAALLGHLDLIRELGRVIRRAGARLFYTQGFHPKPSMSFGPALSLGVMSLDEYVDVKLVAPPDAEQLVNQLNEAAAGGLQFLGAAPLAPKAPAIGSVICGARYLVAIAASTIQGRGGEAWLSAQIETFRAQESVRVIRRTKGIGRPVDVRRAVTHVAICQSGDERLERAGVVGDFHVVELDARIASEGSAKVSEIVEGIFCEQDLPHLAVRARFLTGDFGATPLDLCAVEAPRRERGVVAETQPIGG
jgi:radical SAM-linked protein